MSKRILIIYDEAELISGLKEALLDRGHYVVVAADSALGAVSLMLSSYDLVITGLILPGIDGWEVISQARKTYGGRIKIAALSRGLGQRLPARIALDVAICAGADAAFEYPGDTLALIANIESLLSETPKPAIAA